MALAKAVVTGSVFRAPEKRFTQNNVPVSSFVLNIGEREEMLLRVVVRRTSLDEVVSSISKDDRVLVEGRLQKKTHINGVSTDLSLDDLRTAQGVSLAKQRRCWK